MRNNIHGLINEQELSYQKTENVFVEWEIDYIINILVLYQYDDKS